MISQTVQELADQLAQKWNLRARGIPSVVLDGSWPSIALCDSLTYPLRGKERFSAEDNELVRETAAYLAVLAHKCWERFGVTVEVDSGEQGIYIKSVDGSANEKNRQSVVPIETALRQCLKTLPQPFPVIGEYTFNLSGEQSIYNRFGIGLMTGLSPFCEGRWSTETVKSFREHIDEAVKVLARSSADYYARVFPEEKLGQVAELYLSRLIYPPSGMEEVLPAAGAIGSVLEFFEEYKVSQASMMKVSANLARSPDEVISQIGLALYGALCDGVPSREVIAASEVKGSYVGVLREAMLRAREKLNLPADWIVQGEFTKEEEARFDVEVTLGFLPWVKLSKKRIRMKRTDANIVPLLERLSYFDLDECVKLIDAMLSAAPGDIEVRIQRIYLDMLSTNMEKATTEFRKLLSEPGAEGEVMLFNLWGLCEISRGNFDDAIKYLLGARRLMRLDDRTVSYQVLSNLGWSLAVTGKLEEGLGILNEAIRIAPSPVSAMLSKASILAELGRSYESRMVQEELRKISPLDREVFGILQAQPTELVSH